MVRKAAVVSDHGEWSVIGLPYVLSVLKIVPVLEDPAAYALL
jgi:hypothetical protein